MVRSLILSNRPDDEDSTDGFIKWPFMTTQCWGEDPKGVWTLEVIVNKKGSHRDLDADAVADEDEDDDDEEGGVLTEWMLMLHGTQRPPYVAMQTSDATSKLAIAKRAHEKMEKMRKRTV